MRSIIIAQLIAPLTQSWARVCPMLESIKAPVMPSYLPDWNGLGRADTTVAVYWYGDRV
jgi:hypothetical protein